jgi:hypothetical protein
VIEGSRFSTAAQKNKGRFFMKKNAWLVGGFLTLLFLSALVLAGCGPTIPAKLGDDATYKEYMDKLDEVITYCDSKDTDNNKTIKFWVELTKSTYEGLATAESSWDSWKADAIESINDFIDSLD